MRRFLAIERATLSSHGALGRIRNRNGVEDMLAVIVGIQILSSGSKGLKKASVLTRKMIQAEEETGQRGMKHKVGQRESCTR